MTTSAGTTASLSRAEDVKFTLELIINPNFRSWRTAGHALVRDITVISPTEISWRMEQAFAPYLSFLTETFIVPKHILEKEANPNNAAFNQAPVGTGAFKWGQRVAGDHLELVANPDYFGEGPHIEKLIFKYIPDLTVLYTQFKSGDVDLMGQPYITADHYEEAKALANRVVTLVPKASFESFYLNLERPQFKELAVREALYAAIDKESIIQGLYYGVPTPTETFMPRQSLYFNPNLPTHEFNLNRARQILDKAGWAAGTGRRSCQRRRPSVLHQLDHVGRSPSRAGAAVLAADICSNSAIEMKISNLPAAVMWGDFWVQSQFDSVIVGSTYLIGADPDVTNRLHSRSIPAKGGRGSNNAQYSNPEVDALLDQGARSFDPDARRSIYRRVQELVRRDLPFLPLYQTNAVQGNKKGISGVVPNVNTRTESWNALAWSWAS